MPHDERFEVAVRGSRTAVFAYGDREKPGILAIHGFRGTHSGLEPLAVALAESGYRVLVPDLPGSGESSPMSGRHDATGYGEWLRTLAAELGSPGTLLGHSFGTIIVSAATARGIAHDNVVLVNPIASPVLDHTNKAGAALVWLYYALAQLVPEKFSRQLLANTTIAAIGGELMMRSDDRTLRRWIRREHRRSAGAFATRDVVFESYRACVTSTVNDFLDATIGPTLVLAAGRDALNPLHAQRELTRRIRHSAFHVFPMLGHLLPYEATRECAELIAAWEPAVTRATGRICGGWPDRPAGCRTG